MFAFVSARNEDKSEQTKKDSIESTILKLIQKTLKVFVLEGIRIFEVN